MTPLRGRLRSLFQSRDRKGVPPAAGAVLAPEALPLRHGRGSVRPTLLRHPLRAALRFCLLALGVFVVADLAWPIVGGAYAWTYRATGEALFGTFGSRGFVRLQAKSVPEGFLDTETVLGKRGVRSTVVVSQSSLVLGYLPTAELVALVLASPIPWSRKWRSMALGLLAIQAFIAVRLLLTVVHQYSLAGPVRLFDPGPFWSSVLAIARQTICVSPTFSFVLPVFVWIVVALRREDINRIMGKAG